jgi:hypothetical protein
LKNWAENYRKKRKNEFFKHISPEILDRFLTGKEIDVEEFSEMWLNSYERKLLFSLFSDKLLIKNLKYAMNQAGYNKLYEFGLPKHYNDAIENMFLPELIERFERKVMYE